MTKSLKKKVSDWMSRAIRLEAVQDFRMRYKDPDAEHIECITCGQIVHVKKSDMGHWKGRGIGGGSGAYFDERNVAAQCKPCNGFEGGRQKEFEQYIIKKYNRETAEEIERLHKLPSRWGPKQYPSLILYWKGRTEQALEATKMKQWW